MDNRDNGQVWQFDNPASRLNYTGGAGGFAIVDSNFYGAGGTQNTELITPAPVSYTHLTLPTIYSV